VVSDHSPCVPALKEGGFDTAWGGISSLELGLPVVWTSARARGHGLGDVVRWMASGPASLAGLTAKGRIEAGRDADLVAFAADRAFTVDAGALRQRHPVTPYSGRELTGVVEAVWLRGSPIGPVPRGRLLRRDR
jgi:allantoinase